MQLIYDKSQLIKTPYVSDPKGSFVINSPQLEVALLKSPFPQELLAEIWVSAATAGPPGHVHGGCQAAILDEVMGSTAWHHGFAVVAAKIEVEFLAMMPVERQYSSRGWITSVNDRKIQVAAEISDGKKIYTRSTGLFICLTEEQRQALRGF